MRKLVVHDLETGETTLQEHDGSAMTVQPITAQEYDRLHKPLTAEERKAIISEIKHELGLIQEDAENRKGDAAPTKEQSTANS